MTKFWKLQPNARNIAYNGRGLLESYIMAKGSNSRSNKEAKKPKKDRSKDKAKSAAESNKSAINIGRKK